jgi:phenylacetate-CoA ligase
VIGTVVGVARVGIAARLRRTGLHRLRDLKVRRMVRHAAGTVAFYRERFRMDGIDPRGIAGAADLEHLPIVTRAEIQSVPRKDRVPDGLDPASCLAARTSGSTGEPLEVLLTRRDFAVRQAVEMRCLTAVGFKPWDRLVTLGRTRPQARRLHNRLGLYPSWMIPPTMPLEEQVRTLRRLRPTVLWAYPTALRTLMNFLEDDLSSVVRPRMLITGAERFDDSLRRRFLAACPTDEVFDFYGAVEIGRIAAECRAHAGLHVNTDFVIVECVADPTLPSGLGHVVITTLEAFASPLLRYRIGDLCSAPREGCPCGSRQPLIDHLAGRENEVLRLPGGRLLPFHALNIVLRDVEDLHQFRVIQEAEDRVLVLLAPRGRLPQQTLDTVRDRLREALGEEVEVTVQGRDTIAASELKARPFVSKLDDREG